ncbi:SDR family oxidoreductase [Nocardioides marmotae]|uniref:NAD(P)H-binding protein n=1 Tax=Nocardioides marmotae TaxID=2663857 RepID=A0A6I3ISJ7_9ACTN|nr:NmrA family NAD(P)-binding protein [Nocardioides marmotae]MCR6029873.1 NAD(P)H-binding protein [Gordonia jinghuaiqii]MBC9732829.1 NmrA family NAD(P)-binding protein [Nocardioides marmotae]MTB83943.1 NAD(P)H-binding protein [Nocardioides marmotae]MTB93503.1 NAD(P)H-binding protein [Nocardioides marmotae]QKD99881.1 NmrA family NAD(P)-binding protein [Nocardioides marmotae]
MNVAVLGGTGKTGRAVVAALAQVGVSARPLGRSAFEDLPAALAGADAVHVIAPNLHPDEPAYVASVLAAAAEANVDRLTYHSVASPYAPSMPHHLGKAVAEDLVRRSGLRWTVLQPCAYVQNFLPALADLPAEGGELAVPYAVDTPFGLVDLDDVAAATAVVLTTPGHEGATYELGGPALVTVAGVAGAAAEVLERPVRARRTDPDAWRGEGLDERERAWLRSMFAYYDDHGLPTGPLPLAALLAMVGRAPSPVADVLARVLAGTS